MPNGKGRSMNLVGFVKLRLPVWPIGLLAAIVCFGGFSVTESRAAFELMQIEQVIGGVNGDFTAQAVQLRMRDNGQNQLSQVCMYAYDIHGNNPVLLIDFSSNVANSAAGSRILVATSAF